MTALFPTFTNLLQCAKRFLATDVKSLWQALEEPEVSPESSFYDGYIYHPPII